MTIIPLSILDLIIAASLVLLLAIASFGFRLSIEKQLIVSGIRTVIQLSLIGYVLKFLFQEEKLIWISIMAVIMVVAGGREVAARQKYQLKGQWNFAMGTSALFISSFTIAIFALNLIINTSPWYKPQYAIPLLGMLLGNTMTGIALAMNHFIQNTVQQRTIIEQRLLLGQSGSEAISDIRKESMKTGLIPSINSMATVGLVSLPGMMTGQILAGNSPVDAVKYQILIMFLICGGTGFGIMLSVSLTARHIFDSRHRLKITRLVKEEMP